MVAEGGDLVVVDTELVGHVDAEPLGPHLQGRQNTGSLPTSFTHRVLCAGAPTDLLSPKAWPLSGTGPSGVLEATLTNKVENLPGPQLLVPVIHSPCLRLTLGGQACPLCSPSSTAGFKFSQSLSPTFYLTFWWLRRCRVCFSMVLGA